jgi:hypothetical protein
VPRRPVLCPRSQTKRSNVKLILPNRGALFHEIRGSISLPSHPRRRRRRQPSGSGRPSASRWSDPFRLPVAIPSDAPYYPPTTAMAAIFFRVKVAVESLRPQDMVEISVNPDTTWEEAKLAACEAAYADPVDVGSRRLLFRGRERSPTGTLVNDGVKPGHKLMLGKRRVQAGTGEGRAGGADGADQGGSPASVPAVGGLHFPAA